MKLAASQTRGGNVQLAQGSGLSLFHWLLAVLVVRSGALHVRQFALQRYEFIRNLV